MDPNLYNMIYKRKSFHTFRKVGTKAGETTAYTERLTPAELDEIRAAWQTFTPLYPEIRTEIRIVGDAGSTCRRGQEYCILLYSEKRDGYLANIAYLGEQLDLYLVSRNIGTLWYGIGRPLGRAPRGMSYCIMIAIRKVSDPAAYRKDMYKSKRKPAGEIWEGEEIPGVTDIIRFAPSACNSQPWYIRHEAEQLAVYRSRKPGRVGIMPAPLVPYYNRIDMGILLCFLDLCLDHEGIAYERELHTDDGKEMGLTLNAVYKLL